MATGGGPRKRKGNNAGCGANGKRDEEETITQVSRFGLDWIGYCGGAAADVFSLKQRPRAASVEWLKRRRPFYPRSFVQLLLLLVDLMKEKRSKKIDRSRDPSRIFEYSDIRIIQGEYEYEFLKSNIRIV